MNSIHLKFHLKVIIPSILLTIILSLFTTTGSLAQGSLNPVPFIDLEYNYDPAGNITSIINHIDPDYSSVMNYDSLERLTGVNGPWGNGSFTYDELGNRTSKFINNEYIEYGYKYSTNQLDNVIHDGNGNIISDSEHRYVYDSENRLTEVWTGDSRDAEYHYDAFGRRISKTDENGKTTYYAYGKGLKVLSELNSYGVPEVDYVYAGESRIARVDLNATAYEKSIYFYHGNNLGSNISITDNTTSVTWDKDYLPFGSLYDDQFSDLVDNTNTYTSKDLDNETGLYYFGARYYNPKLGRFMSVDPAGIDITNPQSFNRYTYVQNNPYKYVDPDGRAILNLDYFLKSRRNLRKKLDFIPEFLLDLILPIDKQSIALSLLPEPQVFGGVINNLSENSVKALAKPKYAANAGGYIRSFVTETDETFYRVFSNNKTGGFLTKVRPKNKIQAIEGLALPSENSAEYIQEILVPKGTILQRSRVLPAFGRRGGREQFRLLDIISNEYFGEGVRFE